MMWLGIVLHVSLNHIVGESPAPWRDSKPTLVADFLIAFIHAFRMPVFFVLAGFFVAMLISQWGYLGMLKHRLRRLALPFAVFWPLVFPAMGVLVLVFVHQMVRGTFGLDASLMPRPPNGPLLNTMHMWFIYLLMWFCIVTAALAWLAKFLPAVAILMLSSALNRLATTWWGVLVLALPLAAVGASYRAGLVMASGSFAPHVAEWVQSGVFYMVGLALYQCRDTALSFLSKNCWVYGLAGLATFLAWLAIFETTRIHPAVLPQPQAFMAYAYGCTSWLWSFALIGGFIRYLPKQNSTLQYLADSSYWAYLVHMLGTIGFGALMFSWPLGALSKMGLNMLATTVFCLLTYQLFVRDRFIGRLLNGQKGDARARDLKSNDPKFRTQSLG
jgi:glucans biosynthesis protein C